MAKKFSGNQVIYVTPKSKSATWQYTGGVTPYTFTLVNQALESGYDHNYRSFAVRSKNDIVVTTMFATQTGKVKKVTNTIKNYFADTTADYKVQYSHMNAAEVYLTVKPSTQAGYSGFFGMVDPAEYYLASSAKNADMITFSAIHKTEVLDLKGNDSYRTNHDIEMTDYFYELAGNDNYETVAGGIMWVNDYSGKDKYKISGSESFLNAYDYKGNDDYSMTGCTGFVINDYAGNDIYRVDNSNEDADKEIADFKGNDKYQVKDTSIAIEDNAGKDNYQIYNTKARINDTGKGNDTYGIYDCFNMSYDSSNFNIEDEKGNETYNITGLTFNDEALMCNAITDVSGNDKYNFKDGESDKVNVNKVFVHDESGKDKYNLTVSYSTGKINNVKIYDKAGADSYTITGHEDSYIINTHIYDYSKNSKDKYNFSKVLGSTINDDGGNDTYKLDDCRACNIFDEVGNDKYTIKHTSKDFISIIDSGKGNDSYTVDISEGNNNYVVITDAGGKDSLTLLGLKKDNLVFMTDIKKDKTVFLNNLVVYNKETKGFVAISGFYDVKDGAITGFGDGRIETVKAGKTTLKDAQSEALYNDFNSLRETVANWLSESGKNRVLDVLQNGTDYQKDCLVALFTHTDPPVLE